MVPLEMLFILLVLAAIIVAALYWTRTGFNALDIFPKGNVDAFDRQRTSEPVTLFDSQSQYDKSPLLFNEKTAVGGTLVHDPDNSAVALNVTTNPGSLALRQTKRYFRYYPGKSQLIMLSLTGVAPKDNLYQEYGYGDDENGILFAVAGQSLRIVERTSTSGSPVDHIVEQADWNIDPMDGTGPSGVTLDMSKRQILAIDLEWLGVGMVRVGFVFNGITYYCHGFRNSNVGTGVYMTTANLPVRWKLLNSGATLTSSTALSICCSVSSEAGFDEQYGYPFAVSNSVAGRSVTTTETALLAVRPRSTFKGQTNRVSLLPTQYDHYAHTSPVLFRIYFNSTVTGGTWAGVNAESTAEVNPTVTGFSGGILVAEAFVPANRQGSTILSGAGSGRLYSVLSLNLDIDGLNPDTILITGQTLIGTASTPVVNSIGWNEIR